jgi:hypothetical protein
MAASSKLKIIVQQIAGGNNGEQKIKSGMENYNL